MVKMPNKAHNYTDYMHSLTNCVHRICDLHEYRLLTHTFPQITILAKDLQIIDIVTAILGI